MRIVVVEFAGRGGLIHHAFQLCRALQQEGATVTLVTDASFELGALPREFEVKCLLRLWDAKPAGGPAPGALAALGRRARRAGRALAWHREWLRLCAWLVRERPDVVLFGDLRFPIDVAWLRVLRAAGLRLADICHNVHPFSSSSSGPILWRSSLSGALFRALYRSFDAVFVHFESNRALFLGAFGVEPERVAVIAHGDEDLFHELRDPALTTTDVRRELGIAPDAPVVLLLGTLTRYKGADILLEAFARVVAARPDARLVVAGFPAADFDVEAFRARAAALGIAGEVRLAPRYVETPQVAAWMEMASVVAFPYRMVFQSGALLLAHAFSKPVVATRVGAMAEVVEDGATGLLVPAENEAALSSALLRLIAEPAFARSLGDAARRRARERFAWRGIARTMLDHLARKERR